MRAFWMNPAEVACTLEELRAEGIVCQSFVPSELAAATSRVRTELRLPAHEDVRLQPNDPKDEAKIARESDEHAHMEDEVRLIVEGSALYDVRGRDERWLRVFLNPGDIVLIPARRYHRFVLGGTAGVRYVQAFNERPGLIPLYRASDDETRC